MTSPGPVPVTPDLQQRDAMLKWVGEAIRVIDAAYAFGLDADLRGRMRSLIETATSEMFEEAFPHAP